MLASIILAKTAKGQDEIKTRAAGLPHQLRSLLIVVDGKLSVGDIVQRFGGIAEIETGLQSLLEQGLVEAKSSGGAAAESPALVGPTPAVSAAVAPASIGATRAEAIANLSRFVYDAVGPGAEIVTEALESAANLPELIAAAERCAGMIEGIGAPKKAAAFRERVKLCADQFFSR